MTCNRCGKEQSPRNDSRFCAYCGSELYPRQAATGEGARGPWWEELENTPRPARPNTAFANVDFDDEVFKTRPAAPSRPVAPAASDEPLTMREIPLAGTGVPSVEAAPGPELDVTQLLPVRAELGPSVHTGPAGATLEVGELPSVVARLQSDDGPASELAAPATVALTPAPVDERPPAEEEPTTLLPVASSAEPAPEPEPAPEVVEASPMPAEEAPASAEPESIADAATEATPVPTPLLRAVAAPEEPESSRPRRGDDATPATVIEFAVSEVAAVTTIEPAPELAPRPAVEAAPEPSLPPPATDFAAMEAPTASGSSLAEAWGGSLSDLGPLTARPALEPLEPTVVQPVSAANPTAPKAGGSDWDSFDEDERDRADFQSLFRSRFGRSATGFSADRPLDLARPAIAFELHQKSANRLTPPATVAARPSSPRPGPEPELEVSTRGASVNTKLEFAASPLATPVDRPTPALGRPAARIEPRRAPPVSTAAEAAWFVDTGASEPEPETKP